ncbi:MAG: mechanosensitive ion channel [Hyphomonadaceae bacterium]|nr:mechanosensitive ion channel [Hyphomonadaceae bacterium]
MPQDPSPTGLIAEFERALAAALALPPHEAAIRGGLSVLIVFAATIVFIVLRKILFALIQRHNDGHDAHETGRTLRRALGWTRRIVTLGVALFALLMIASLWGFDVAAALRGRVGETLGMLGRLILIFALAVAAAEISRFVISAILNRAAQRSRDLRRAAQLRTLAPVLIGVVQTAAAVLAAITALSELGVDVGPLLAGAGIVGIAVGFGAQTLVKDFLTGVFLIMEDIVSIGDDVQIRDFSGTVEAMTLRTIRVRAFDGTLHIFPYGEAQIISNRSRLFAYAVCDLQISYLSDIDRALAVIAQTGTELRADPALAKDILAPIEVFGVDKLADNAVLVKARIKTGPGDQGAVAREFLKRVKRALDEAGVLLAHRHLPVPPFDAIRDRANP